MVDAEGAEGFRLFPTALDPPERGEGTNPRERLWRRGVGEFEPNRKLTLEATTPFPMTIAFTVESVSGQTRVNQWSMRSQATFFKLAGPLLVAAAKRQFKNDVDTFRDLMEADALTD